MIECMRVIIGMARLTAVQLRFLFGRKDVKDLKKNWVLNIFYFGCCGKKQVKVRNEETNQTGAL